MGRIKDQEQGGRWRSLLFLEELLRAHRGKEVQGSRGGGGTWNRGCRLFVGGIKSNVTVILR